MTREMVWANINGLSELFLHQKIGKTTIGLDDLHQRHGRHFFLVQEKKNKNFSRMATFYKFLNNKKKTRNLTAKNQLDNKCLLSSR